jgi:hypothetical protein
MLKNPYDFLPLEIKIARLSSKFSSPVVGQGQQILVARTSLAISSS